MSEGILTEWSKAVAGLVRGAADAVVRVEARRRRPASGAVFSADGFIVVASHAVEREEGITIGFADASEGKATLVGRDPTTDLALLKLDKTGLPAPTWAPTAALEVGQFALAVGRPGKSLRAATGIIHAAATDPWRTPSGGTLERYVEVDYELPPGFSGGPVLDAQGRWIGISSSGILRGATMVIPAATVARVVEQLKSHGKLRRGYVGVGASAVRIPEDLREKAGAQTGLLVFSVDPNGPARAAGVVLGDTILAVDGEPVPSLEDLFALLTPDRIGKAVPVKVIRAGEITTLTLTVTERS